MFNDPSKLNKSELEAGETLAPNFGASGLITAVAQDSSSGEILMLAHMNAEALEKTISTGFAHFWSRSRKELWKKGETSGNTLAVRQIKLDCDQDAILLIVEMNGSGACHTGRTSCFYRSVRADDGNYKLTIIDDNVS